MADILWPDDLVPFAQSFYLQPHVGRSESPFSRAQKLYGLSAPRWLTSLSFRGGTGPQWGTDGVAIYGPRLDAFIAKLEGGLNRVAIWDFRREGTNVSHTHAEIAAGTSQLLLEGTTDAVGAGDYVGGDGRPHIVTDTEVSGADLIVNVRPHFDSLIAADEAIFYQVAGWFRLISDDAGANGSEVGQLTTYTLDFAEDPGPSTDVIYEGETVTYSG